ncbi:MAG TPA: TonB-dependent receptor [Gammaproteobacteria bacterium]
MNETKRPRNCAPRPSRLALAVSAVLCAGLLPIAPASAQQEDEEGATRGLEEIVVTARFREESLQETPLAISAISAESLENVGASSVIDIADWAPNVVIDQLGSGWGPTLAASVRGLGYGDFKATSEPTVTIYIDDVVLGRPTGAILDLLDLERVEVLRGPQGTLFGKNAIGGVVRLISRKPGEGDGGGNVELTVGTYDRLDVRGSFETTLIEDKLFSRVSYVSKRRDGWQDNVDFRCYMIQRGTPQLAGVGDGIIGWDTATDTPIMGVPFSEEDNAFALPTRTSERGTDRNCVVGTFGDENVQAARGILRYVASDRFELSVAADITDQKATSPYDLVEFINPDSTNNLRFTNEVAKPRWGVPYDGRFVPPSEDINFAGFDDNSGVDGGIETPNMNDFTHWGVSTTFDWNFDSLAVKAILAHREFDAQWGRDSDGSPMPINHTLDTFRDDQDTAELRFSGTLFDDRTEWTVGAFYFNADDFNSNISVLYPCLNVQSCIDRVDTQNTRNTGLFLNTVTDLTDRLSLTVGVRRSDDEKEILQERFDRDGNPCCGFETLTLVRAEATETDPMVSLAYDVTDNIMVFATYQEGFRGGGTSARPTSRTRVPFGPETLENVEIGMKADFLDRRVRVNASIFDMTYEDMQIASAGLDEFNNPSWITSNAGSADIDGFEIELQSTIGDHWLVDATIGHTDFQYTDVPTLADCIANGFPASSCTGILNADSTPARTPRYKASVDLGWMTDLRAGSQISWHIGASYQDETFYAANNDPLARAPAFTLVNARITWTSPDRSWEAALFGTNITDERAIQSKLNFLAVAGTIETTYVRPEEWAMSIRKRF